MFGEERKEGKQANGRERTSKAKFIFRRVFTFQENVFFLTRNLSLLNALKEHRHARRARVICLCEVSEIGAFMERFTVTIWLI